jgi:hypothetical protein
MINQNNIKDFISYLFQKKNRHDAPIEVLQSWNDIPEAEIMTHLKTMTQQWGWDDVKLNNEILAFIQYKTSVSQKSNTTFIPKNNSYTNQSIISKSKQRNNKWIYFVLIPILIGIGYISFQYYNFINLYRLYTITDNVAMRDENGNTVGRMDVLTNIKTSLSSLRAMDNTVYNIQVGNDDKISESRKLLLDDATFKDYLTKNKEKIVYVNKNYLTENENYNNIQKSVFADINHNALELKNITSNMRKVIIGSLSQNTNLQGLKIANTCNNKSSEYTSILKHTLNDDKTIVIICKMSDNNYYKFKGIPDENTYFVPEKVLFKMPHDSTLTELSNTNFLFKKINGRYFVYDCNKTNFDVYSTFDNKGDITYFNWSYDPQ